MTRVVLGLLCAVVIGRVAAQDSTTTSPRHALAVYTVKPEYSFAARSHWLEGRGVFLLTVRPDGSVQSVDVLKTTGHSELDEAAVAAFRQWRFKPGAVTKVKIPMDFTMAGLRPRGIDSALQAEKQGSRPPSGNASWREYWRKCIPLWNGYHRPDYAEYFRKHRKALGLEDIGAP